MCHYFEHMFPKLPARWADTALGVALAGDSRPHSAGTKTIFTKMS
jgi:hypothetical protein